MILFCLEILIIKIGFVWILDEWKMNIFCDLFFFIFKCVFFNVFVMVLRGGVSVKMYFILSYWNMIIVFVFLLDIIEEISSGFLIWWYDW